MTGNSLPRPKSSVLEPVAEAARSEGRMSQGAAWAKGVALGNVASSPMDSAAGLDWGPVWGEKTVVPSSKILYHLLSQFILTAALGSLDVVGPILQMKS